MKIDKRNLPNGWRILKVSDCGKIYSGGTPDTNNPEYWDGSVKWITPSEVSKLKTRYIAETDRKITSFGVEKSAATILPPNSVIVCTRASIGSCCINKVEMTTNQGFKSIIPNAKSNADFLYYLLSFNKNKIIRKACGSTFLEISKKDFENIKILVPPIEEQRRIAEVLSTWDEGIENLEKLIALKEKQKRALMQRLLTGKTRLKGFSTPWKEVKLGDIGVFSKGKGITKDILISNGIPCIRYGEIYTTFDFIFNHPLSFIPKEKTNGLIKAKIGDILFASSGETKVDIGKSITFLDEYELFVGGDILIFSTNKEVNSIFITYCLNTVSRRNLNKLGQGDSVVHIYESHLEKLRLKIPSFKEQQTIAEVLTTSDNEISQLKNKLEGFKKQKKYLMQQLLTGKKRLV